MKVGLCLRGVCGSLGSRDVREKTTAASRVCHVPQLAEAIVSRDTISHETAV